MKKNNLLVITLCLICVTSCDINNQKLRLTNNSDVLVFYRLLTNNTPSLDLHTYHLYPFDTVYPNFVMGIGDGVWEYKINNKTKDSTLYIYIFDEENISEQKIKNNLYKKKGFKVKDLDSLNWIVTYPDDF